MHTAKEIPTPYTVPPASNVEVIQATVVPIHDPLRHRTRYVTFASTLHYSCLASAEE